MGTGDEPVVRPPLLSMQTTSQRPYGNTNAAGIHADAAPRPAVIRSPMYFGTGDETLFAWHHHAPRAIARDCVAVLCAPIGPEYTRSHRTLRHFADRLAEAGVPAVRFDYQGCGDSAGEEDAPDRVGAWRRSIAAAVWHARRISGCSRVCLIGIRLGATLAALEAEEVGADLVVLWNPVVKGRAYTRELQAIAMTAAEGAAKVDDGFECAGFRISGETLAALKAIDLARTGFKPRARVLLAVRDDMSFDPAFGTHLAETGIAHDTVALPGWNGMMADHQWTVVPDEALAVIVEWIRTHTVARPTLRPDLELPAERLAIGEVRETLCRFGADRHLFGVLSQPAAGTDRPAVIMLNAGSIHHVGPSRLYVRLARELAQDGIASLRLDHEGLGDSVLRADGVENEPYAASAMDDLRAAIALLQEHGHRRFILLGLCSGAHTAFHACREFDGDGIALAVLINPWYFYWQAGMISDPNCDHFEQVVTMQKSMRSPGRWKRLLRGEIGLGRVKDAARTMAAHAARKARALLSEAAEIVVPSAGTRLSQDLRSIFARGRTLWLYESDGEPAGAVAMTEARRTCKRALREGRLVHQRIAGGDHTFSQSAARAEVIRRLRHALKQTCDKEAP